MAHWADLIDNSLVNEFNAPVYDPAKDRKKVIKMLELTEKQFGAVPPSKAPNKAWKAKGRVVEFAPKIGGNALVLKGSEVNYYPSERFPEVLSSLKADVESGALDDEITAALSGNAGSKPASRGSNAADPGPAPGPGYKLNKKGTKWRSPEQQVSDAAGAKARAANRSK